MAYIRIFFTLQKLDEIMQGDGFSGQNFCIFEIIFCFAVATCICDLLHDVEAILGLC